MTFSDYKHISQVQEEFRIIAQEERFLSPKSLELPAKFVEEFMFNQEYFDPYASRGGTNGTDYVAAASRSL